MPADVSPASQSTPAEVVTQDVKPKQEQTPTKLGEGTSPVPAVPKRSQLGKDLLSIRQSQPARTKLLPRASVQKLGAARPMPIPLPIRCRSLTLRNSRKELEVLRTSLSKRLYNLKHLLARTAREGKWTELRQQDIPRTTADRYVDKWKLSISPALEKRTSGAISEPTKEEIAQMVKKLKPTCCTCCEELRR